MRYMYVIKCLFGLKGIVQTVFLFWGRFVMDIFLTIVLKSIIAFHSYLHSYVAFLIPVG